MSQVVEIRLLNRPHRIVTQGDPETVQNCAAIIRNKIDDLRRDGAVVSGERLLVLVALNLAEDLLKLQQQQGEAQSDLTSTIETIVSQAEALANAPLR